MEQLKAKLQQAGIGLPFIAMGLFIAIFAPLHPEGANAPMWVVEAVAACFTFAGVSAVAKAFGAELVSKLAALATAYLLATPGLWLLFAGDDAQCSSSVGSAGLSLTADAGSILCRSAFGIGGILTVLIALAFTWQAIKASRPSAATAPRPE